MDLPNTCVFNTKLGITLIAELATCVATDFLPVRQQSYRPIKCASFGRLKCRIPSNGPHYTSFGTYLCLLIHIVVFDIRHMLWRGKVNLANQLSDGYRQQTIKHNESVRHNREILSKIINCLKGVCSNANPLHYYALRVTRKADRWRWVWSIFNSRTAWADHITCGTSIV